VVQNAAYYKTVDSARLCPFFSEDAGLHSQFCWENIRFEVSLDFHVFLKTVDGQYTQFQCRFKKKIKNQQNKAFIYRTYVHEFLIAFIPLCYSSLTNYKFPSKSFIILLLN